MATTFRSSVSDPLLLMPAALVHHGVALHAGPPHDGCSSHRRDGSVAGDGDSPPAERVGRLLMALVVLVAVAASLIAPPFALATPITLSSDPADRTPPEGSGVGLVGWYEKYYVQPAYAEGKLTLTVRFGDVDGKLVPTPPEMKVRYLIDNVPITGVVDATATVPYSVAGRSAGRHALSVEVISARQIYGGVPDPERSQHQRPPAGGHPTRSLRHPDIRCQTQTLAAPGARSRSHRFGDLVTMAWWNGIWLNEAFATFMEMLAVDAWKPEWERWANFGVSRAAAMGVDGLLASRPIEFPVREPKECEAMFDLLTYEKGASVLRMLEQYLGTEVFREGVRRYLREHPYANAETSDLWKALGAASGQPIPEAMDGWIFRGGYPLVTVEPDGAGVKLSQRRFLYLGDDAGDGAAGEPWRIPIALRASVKGGWVDKRLLLDGQETRVELPAVPDWALANAGGHGFYRVAFAPAMLKKLARSVGKIAPIERFNVVSDAFAVTQAGHMSAVDYLDLTGKFREETDRNVWTALTGSLAFVNRVIPQSARAGLEAFVRHRVGPATARLGWEAEPGESELVRQLRGDLIRVLGTLGNDEETQAQARAFYARYLQDERAVDPNILPAVIGIIAAVGGAAEYADFLQRFGSARTPQEEQRFLFALGAFRDPALIAQTLERTINGEVRSQDAPFLMRAMLSGVYSRALAWEFVEQHWQTMAKQYPGSAYRRMYEGVTALVSPEWERDVNEFFTSRGIVLGGKTLDQYLEHLRGAVRFQQREGAALTGYLARTPR